MELDAAAAVMAGLGGVAPHAVDEFRDFLQKIKEQVQVTDFIQVVGTDLLGAKVAKLTRRIRESGVHIADIEVGAEWSGKQDEWWEEHGALFVERLQDKWKSRAAGGGALTDKMLEGKYLSVPEASYVVQHKDFDLLMRKLEAEDWPGVRLLTGEKERFGQLVRKGALYFRELGGKAPKAAKEDHDRAALDAMLHRYSSLWTGKILMDTVRAEYTRREVFPSRFGEALHHRRSGCRLHGFELVRSRSGFLVALLS